MEMRDLIKFVMDLMETMYPNGGLIIPHRTLHVEQQLGLHTMEVLIMDIPYPPPFLHLFTLPHPDIVKITPEPHHDPPRLVIIGKPYALNMAMTARLLLSIQSSVMEMIRLQLGTAIPDSVRSNTFHILGLSRQLDIVIDHRLHALVQSLTPSSPSTETPAHKRLVTRLKRASTNMDSANTPVQWSVTPPLVTQVPHIAPGEPFIIPTNVFSSDEDTATESEEVTSMKRCMLSTPSHHTEATE
jgi:hypothetical protein